jgi:hypothetical protein
MFRSRSEKLDHREYFINFKCVHVTLVGTFWISFQAVTSSDNDEDTEEESEEVTMIFQFPETFICKIVLV